MVIDVIEPKEIEYFSSVSSKIKSLFDSEKIETSTILFEKLLTFLSGACTYEEEGVKIKPNILLGVNIDNALKVVSNKYKLCIFEDDFKCSNFEKKIKALIPFCKNDWIIFIDIKNEKIEYGILRSYSGIKGLTINQMLFCDQALGEEAIDTGMISIEIMNNRQMQIIGLRGSGLTIDFSLIQKSSQNINKVISKLVSDVISNDSLSTDDKDELFVIYTKIFNTAYKKLHGAICLVVKSDFSFPNKTLSDGIWLKEPIKLSDIAKQLVAEKCNNILHEEYYSLTGVFIEMLNIDGITIIDDSGYIRGYNVFITKEQTDGNKEVVGGARKRAYKALIDSKDEMFIGAYFQSQDGHISYERVNKDE